MLPAPMVFPRIHFPDCVGMVVRERDCLVACEGWASVAACEERPWDDGGGAGLAAAAEGMSGG